eukprot:scaffold6882_cov86-Skeletonema_dohrnii-CCMP3373.AAC.1
MIHLRLGTPLGIIRASPTTLWLLPWQWGADPLASSVILWTFYEEGGDALSEGVGSCNRCRLCFAKEQSLRLFHASRLLPSQWTQRCQ